MLSRGDVCGVSARNHLQGQVCRILTLEKSVFVAIDIGQILWGEITQQALTELQLTVGCPVICLLKAHSVGLA
jgi:molybdopterin-binding protein